MASTAKPSTSPSLVPASCCCSGTATHRPYVYERFRRPNLTSSLRACTCQAYGIRTAAPALFSPRDCHGSFISGSLNPKFLASLLPESVLESWRSCSFPGPELGELAGDRRAACLWEQREKGIRTFTPGAYTASSGLVVSRIVACGTCTFRLVMPSFARWTCKLGPPPSRYLAEGPESRNLNPQHKPKALDPKTRQNNKVITRNLEKRKN